MGALRPATSRPLSEKREWNRGPAASHTMGMGGGFFFCWKRLCLSHRSVAARCSALTIRQRRMLRTFAG